MTLLPQHQQLIDESGISAEVALARGYFSAKTKTELADLGFSRSQCAVPALVVPIWNVHGEIANYLVRPDQPRVKDGRTLKYEMPAGSRMVLDVPPTIRDTLGAPSAPLLITEGARKADAAVSAGLSCVSLIGTWAWRGTNEQGGKALLPDFEAVAMNEREIYVGFDSDVTIKPSVGMSLERFVLDRADLDPDRRPQPHRQAADDRVLFRAVHHAAHRAGAAVRDDRARRRRAGCCCSGSASPARSGSCCSPRRCASARSRA